MFLACFSTPVHVHGGVHVSPNMCPPGLETAKEGPKPLSYQSVFSGLRQVFGRPSFGEFQQLLRLDAGRVLGKCFRKSR